MRKVADSKFGKFKPKMGYEYLYVRFPRDYHMDLVGKEIEIYRVDDGFYIKQKPKMSRLKTAPLP